MAYQVARERVSAVNADLQENVAGIRVAQAFRREDRNGERFADLSDEYRVARIRSQRYIAIFFPFVALRVRRGHRARPGLRRRRGSRVAFSLPVR